MVKYVWKGPGPRQATPTKNVPMLRFEGNRNNTGRTQHIERQQTPKTREGV